MSVNGDETGEHPRTGPKAAPKSHQIGFGALPSRTEAENNEDEFYRLVQALQTRRTNPLQGKQIAELLGIDAGTVSRKLNSRSFNKDQMMLVIADIYRRRLIYGSSIEQVRSVPHNLFYSMMDFFDIKENSQDNSIYEAKTEHLVTLDGFAMGMDANLLFFSPIYIELVDNAAALEKLDSTLDIIPATKMPKRVLQKLKRYPRIVR